MLRGMGAGGLEFKSRLSPVNFAVGYLPAEMLQNPSLGLSHAACMGRSIAMLGMFALSAFNAGVLSAAHAAPLGRLPS